MASSYRRKVRMVENNTCYCGAKLPEDSERVHCDPCLVKLKARVAVRRANHIARGLCTICSRPAMPGRVLCQKHTLGRRIAMFAMVFITACGGSDFSANNTARDMVDATMAIDALVNEVTNDASSEDSGDTNVLDTNPVRPDSGSSVEAVEAGTPKPIEYCPLHTAFNDKCSSGLAHWPCNYTPAGCVGSSTGATEVRCCK